MTESDILVTGAAGFIGSNLAISLVKKNYRVIGIDNLSHGNLSNLDEIIHNPLFTFIQRDISFPGSLDECQAPVIVHLASQKIPRYSNSLLTLTQNSQMMRVVLDKCLADKTRVVFASTSDVYGKNPNVPYKEDSDFVTGHSGIKRWSYAVSKIAAEHLIMAYGEEYNLQWSVFRLFGSYGPRQNLSWWGGPQAEFISCALKNVPMEIHGTGRQTRSFLFSDDAINGIVTMIENKNAVNQVINLSASPQDEISILHLGEMIWKMIRNDEPKLKLIPYSTFGSYEDVMRRTGDAGKAKELLGFNPQVSLEEGLRLTIDWQRKVQNL